MYSRKLSSWRVVPKLTDGPQLLHHTTDKGAWIALPLSLLGVPYGGLFGFLAELMGTF